MIPQYDIAVIGSGFAGSLVSMIAKRLGYSVLLLERGSHPRTAIGESSTPLSNLLLETLAKRYDLPLLAPLTKWGTWQTTYPEVACGLKRGFSFFHHQRNPADPIDRAENQLLVGASPKDTIADTHWFRAEFDALLVGQARALDVDYVDEFHIDQINQVAHAWEISGRRRGQDCSFRAKFLIDASGPRGVLHRSFGLEEKPLPNYPRTSSLYGHFTDVDEFASSAALAIENPPFPPDAAALHHVFDGGWMWVLRFNNGWTSAGFALTAPAARKCRLEEKGPAWNRLMLALPDVHRQFAHAQPATPLTYLPQLSFRSASVAAANWAMLPSAAGFVDPLLSTGFPLTLLGITRLAQSLEHHPGSAEFQEGLCDYAAHTDSDLLATARLVGALYANMHHFPTFRALSLLYFASASYAETVRRLGKPQLAGSFLLHRHPVFGPESRRITDRALEHMTPDERRDLQERIYALIEQFDVAGLCTRPANHCYPVRAADLFASAHKVGASHTDIEDLLLRSGFLSPEAHPLAT